MIKYNYEVSVNENRAKLNKDIFLFRGNRNIHYYFSIKGARFAFEKEGDLIENANAIYAAVTVIKPNGVEVANAIAPVENGLIHLKVTEDLIDEEVEIGDFDLVFDLFDDSDGAVTIPKIKGQFHVQERPCTTSIGTLSGNVNVVNQAVVDLAIATQENEQLIVVDDDGKYVKTTWAKGNKISVERLNKMEEGIYNNSSQLKENQINLIEDDTSMEGISDSVHDTLETEDKRIIGGINEVNRKVKDIAKKTIVEGNKIYLVKADGTKLDEGTDLPASSGSSEADGITIKDTGNNFTATNVEGALSELFQSASNGKTLVANAITGKGVATNPSDSFQTIANNIGKIKNSSSAIISQNTLNKCGAKKIKFAVLSDIHIYTDTTKSANVCFTNALNNIKNMGDVDFIAITGDIVRYDFANEIITYKNTISSCTIPIYEVAGNHDATTGDSGLNLTAWKNATGQDPHYEIINNNEVFLFLSQRYWDGANLLSDEDKTWLNQKLEEYKTKPRVFLFFHQYLGNCEGFGLRNGTVNNSVLTDDLETYFTNIASEYKNVIWFSGHSHTRFRYATDYPNVLAYNKNGEFCTMIHTPSLVDTNEYHVVTVYDNLVEIQGYIGNLKADAYNVYFTVDNYDYIEKVESVMLDKSSLNFTNTDTQTITATVTPSNQQNNVIWETSSSSIATVVNGVVTPVGNGNCVITAKCGDKSATCNITVNIAQSELSYTITKNLTNCSISNNANSILQNQTYIATLTANEGCEISSVSVSMGGVDITSTAYNSSNKTIGIDVVTGDIIINCTATEVTASTYELGIFTPNAVSNSYSISVQGKYNNVFIMADTSVTGKGAKILKGEFKLNNMNGLMATNSSGSLLATIDINNVNNITFNKNSIGYSSFASENLGALKYHYIAWSSLKDGISGTITPSANTNTLSIDATKLYDNVIICTSSLSSGVKSFGFVAIMKTSEGTVKSITGYSNTQGTAWSGCKEDVASISYNDGKLVINPGYTTAYFVNTEYKYLAWNNE